MDKLNVDALAEKAAANFTRAMRAQRLTDEKKAFLVRIMGEDTAKAVIDAHDWQQGAAERGQRRKEVPRSPAAAIEQAIRDSAYMWVHEIVASAPPNSDIGSFIDHIVAGLSKLRDTLDSALVQATKEQRASQSELGSYLSDMGINKTH
jgi:hypothetical protein